jgi:HNH endonuclease
LLVRLIMPAVDDIWARDGGRCVWCSTPAHPRDRTVEHLLPRSRGGGTGAHNLLPACRACNRARRSQAIAAYARQRVRDGRDGRAPDVDMLLRGLDRLAADGTAEERRYGARQARAVRDWRASEAALAAHIARYAGS